MPPEQCATHFNCGYVWTIEKSGMGVQTPSVGTYVLEPVTEIDERKRYMSMT